MNNNCKNCVFFETQMKAYSNISEEYGKCLHEKIKDDCILENDSCPIDGIYATCDEYRGHLIVGPLFGCIHFTQKS